MSFGRRQRRSAMEMGHHRSRVAATKRTGSLSRFCSATAVVFLLTLSLMACARDEVSLSPSPAGNVSGTVLLKGAQGGAPGAGLLVTALSRRPHVRPVSTHTFADGSFNFQLQPGWYLLAVDYWGAPATQIYVGESGVSAAPIVAPSRELAQTIRVTVNVAPGVIPPPGVWLGSHLAMLKPVWAELSGHAMISRKRAIAVALGQPGRPARAVLAVVTAPQRILAPHGPMRNWLTWVVTRTMRRPLDPRIGGRPLPGSTPGPPYLVHHSVSFVDARTGEFLLGFFTP